MPVCLDDPLSHGLVAHTISPKSAIDFQLCGRRSINIGLINNMPDAALEATERQFMTLLDLASDGVLVRLSLYALPEVPRNDAGRNRISLVPSQSSACGTDNSTVSS